MDGFLWALQFPSPITPHPSKDTNKQTNETKMNGGHDVSGMRSYMSFNTINHEHI
jgi:hypothetical protein